MTYIFEHIFKTGGTTFNLSYLSGAFPQEEVVIVRGFREPNREDLERLMALPEEEKRRIKVIAGHNTGRLRPYYPDARFITIVRNPVDRAISAYLHAKHHPDAWQYGGRLISENRIGLPEFIRDDVFAREYAEFVSLHDWQAKTVLGPNYSPDLDEQAVTNIIRSRYYFVGHTERLELLLVCLHVLAGFPLVLFNNRLVRNERKLFQPSAEDLAAIEHYSRVDGLLYQCVCRQFERLVEEIWTENIERLYREYLAALNRFRQETKGIETVAPVLFNFPPAGNASSADTDESARSLDPQEELSPGAFSLSDAVSHNQSLLVGSGPIDVTTIPRRWAYAAAFPFRSDALSRESVTGPVLVRIEAKVERGRIGIGCVSPDLTSYLTAEIERTSEDGDTAFDVIVDAIEAHSCGWLVVRNTAEDGAPSRVILGSIRTFKVDKSPAPKLKSHLQDPKYAEGLSDYQRSHLRHRPPAQTFGVISWGCAATGWIARVLGSHPDIYCVHAANTSWHILGGAELLDGVPYLRIIASQGYAYAAAGDVHGISRVHVPELRRVFGELFNAAVVVREPLARLRSQLALFEGYEAVEEPRRSLWNLSYVDGILDRCGLVLPNGDYASRFFVHAVNMLNTILEERQAGKIYRSEDLTGDPQVLGGFIEEITRGKVSPGDEWLKAAVRIGKVDSHSKGNRERELSEWQVSAIRKVVDPQAWDLYEALGYTRPRFL